jgi:HAD superfamily hydrolase (TIGR01509 family)
MKNMIKGIIFDLDGVILDSMIIWNDLGERYLKSLGVEPEQGLNRIIFSMSMEQGADYLKEHYALPFSSDQVLDGIKQMLENFYFNEVLLKPGVPELLAYLKSRDIRITAATSSPREHVERALSRNKVLSYFEKIFTTSETGVSKHEPDIYNLAAASMGSAADETLVFEDSLYALKTAADAGYITVGVYDQNGESNQQGMKDTAVLYLKSMTDFLPNREKLGF